MLETVEKRSAAVFDVEAAIVIAFDVVGEWTEEWIAEFDEEN